MAAGIFVNDRVNVAALLSDAAANRFKVGDVGPGNLCSAAELQANVCPFTETVGHSKVTVWRNDENAINRSSGPEGWGVFFKNERELTRKARIVDIGRWRKA